MQKSVNQQPPSLDAVLVWVTFTIEQDYIQRGVFPQMRATNAAIQHGSTSLHYMTADSVKAILADAKQRSAETRKGLRNAYNAFVRSLEGAIKEAAGRRAIFEAPEAVCTHKSQYNEYWRGTKAQIQALGFRLDGPWPGEEGGKERWAKTRDPKGRDAFITAYSKTWRGLFEVRVEIPDRERKLTVDPDERAKRRAIAEAHLKSMPADEDEYRMKLVEDVRQWLSLIIKTEPVEGHGFSLTDDGAEDILMSCDAVVEAILQAEVRFDAIRHRQVELRYKQQIAEADGSFQHVLSDLTRARPEILEGSTT